MHYIEGFDIEVDVVFNDQLNTVNIDSYDKIVLSPGPGLPKDAGQMFSVIEKYAKTKPILGVCLGFQALVEFFGGDIYNMETVKHGVAVISTFDINSRLFKNTANQFKVGLYHSWAANMQNFPNTLQITGTSQNNIIMAFEHKKLPIAGVQFHPESILTEHGKKIVENFIFEFE